MKLNPNFFSTAYLYARNEFIIPRIDYGVTVKKSRHWKIKDTFSDKLGGFNSIAKDEFSILIKKEYFYKSIYTEVEFFFSKANIQYLEYQNLVRNRSSTWAVVTLYYFLFFNLCCLLRIFNQGYVYFSFAEKDKIDKFNQVINPLVGPISIGNYFFDIVDLDDGFGSIEIKLKKVDTTHKVIWGKFLSVIEILESKANDKEKVIYSIIKKCFDINVFSLSYPSSLRNELNYFGESVFYDFEDSLTCDPLMDINDNFYTSFLKIKYDNNHNSKISSIVFLSSYIFNLNKNLLEDYRERSKFGKDFQKERDRNRLVNYNINS